jgi:hypothetical protein
MLKEFKKCKNIRGIKLWKKSFLTIKKLSKLSKIIYKNRLEKAELMKTR